MNGSIIDTNVILKMLHGEPEAITLLQKVKKAYVSIIIKGELYHGASNSVRREENMDLVRKALSKFKMLSLDDDDIAVSYDLIQSELKKKKTKIPENDIWIAATAHAYGLSLATFDQHFANISQIELVLPERDAEIGMW
jgi:predicted nucleic acid-binding protein